MFKWFRKKRKVENEKQTLPQTEEVKSVINENSVDDSVSNEEVKDDVVNLEKLTVKELRELAKEKGLKGYSSLKKAELIERLK
jgi:hypothetical protein